MPQISPGISCHNPNAFAFRSLQPSILFPEGQNYSNRVELANMKNTYLASATFAFPLVRFAFDRENLMCRTLFIISVVFFLNDSLSTNACAQTQADPANPFADAVVGEWVEYSAQGDSYNAKVLVTVTSIEGNTVTVLDKMFIGDSKKPTVVEHKVDRSKPLSPYFQLMTHQLIGKPITIDSTRAETVTVGDQKIETKRQDFSLRSQFTTTKKKLWTAADSIPVAGVVKITSISQLSSSTIVLTRYGTGNETKEKMANRSEVVANLAKEFTNSVGGEMVQLPASAITVGQLSRAVFYNRIQNAAGEEEKLSLLTQSPPSHPEVIENPFWIGKREVTIGQFRKFVEKTGYRTEPERSGVGGTGRLESGRFGVDQKFNWQSFGFAATDDCPVVNVSHSDAVAFCKWLSGVDGVKYRLPTEFEWEYACRGKSRTVYSCGDKPADLNGHANVADQSLKKVEAGLPWATDFDDGFPYLAPVGSFKPNSFGLFDMHGNALEYCSTRFAMYAPLSDGTAATADALTPGTAFTVRGGNWFNDPALAGSASRSGAEPNTAMSLIGFRIVAESAPDKEE